MHLHYKRSDIFASCSAFELDFLMMLVWEVPGGFPLSGPIVV